MPPSSATSTAMISMMGDSATSSVAAITLSSSIFMGYSERASERAYRNPTLF